MHNKSLLSVNIERIFQKIIHWWCLFFNKFTDTFQHLLKFFFVEIDWFLKIFWRLSFADQSSDKLLEPNWSDSVLVCMLFFARLILARWTEEGILLAIFMKANQSTFLFVGALRVTKRPRLWAWIIDRIFFFSLLR